MSAVAWGLFAKVEDGEWNLQHPVRFSHDDAAADRAMYERGTPIEIRPLYDTDPMAAYAEGRKDEREVWGPVLDEVTNYLEAQDAMDNRELNGINGEDYFALRRRLKRAREHLDAAIKAVTGEQA